LPQIQGVGFHIDPFISMTFWILPYHIRLITAIPYGASLYPVAGRQSPAEALIEIIESEFDTPKLEFWYKNGRGANATLLIGINNMAQEHWLELFWAMY
jgi:hypothetical protein